MKGSLLIRYMVVHAEMLYTLLASPLLGAPPSSGTQKSNLQFPRKESHLANIVQVYVLRAGHLAIHAMLQGHGRRVLRIPERTNASQVQSLPAQAMLYIRFIDGSLHQNQWVLRPLAGDGLTRPIARVLEYLYPRSDVKQVFSFARTLSSSLLQEQLGGKFHCATGARCIARGGS